MAIADAGLNFFIHEEDVGSTRSSVVCPRLQELNPICTINVGDSLDEGTILKHSCVVITIPLPLSELIRLNEFSRSHGVSFLLAFIGGVSSTVFVDHGPNHIVNDKDGEKPIQKLIVDIIPLDGDKNETLVRYESPEGQPATSISSGSFEISEVDGVSGINGLVYEVSHPESDPVKTVRVPFAFKSQDKYISGGMLTEKKVPSKYPMESFNEKIKNPGNTFSFPPTLVLTDLINFGAELQHHVSFVATLSFYEKTGRLPGPYNDADASAILDIAKTLLSDKVIAIDDFDLDEAYILRYAEYAGVELQASGAFVGGVLSQEVVKGTGKLTPIPGFLHFSALEALPDEVPKDREPRGSRYDELAKLYGWEFVEKLSNLKYFMVGCGALGCEFLKNFALTGICCGPEGKLTVTDPDRIELSNLSRQFLFREHNVGQPKSRAGSAMARIMNKDFKIEPLELLLCAKSEETFDDNFWLGIDGVCNALDNMEARFYVDAQCVKYEKSLLESGTMGTGANVGKS